MVKKFFGFVLVWQTVFSVLHAFTDHLVSKALEILQSRRGNASIIIVGDLNCHNADWLDSEDMNGFPNSNPAGITCHTFVTENALENLVYTNTYLRNIGHAKSVLDLVITDIPTCVKLVMKLQLVNLHTSLLLVVLIFNNKKTNLSPEQNGYIIKLIGNW
jgi:hypothetical protein